MKPPIRSRHKTRLAVLHPVGFLLSPAFFLVFALFLFLFTSVKPGLVEGVRTRSVDMMMPLFSAVNKPVEDGFAFVGSVMGYTDLKAENERLKAENERLRAWYQTAVALRTENTSLKNLLSLKEGPRKNYITARVMADSGNSYAESLLIDAGITEGVRKNQAVIGPDGMIGRIIEAGQGVSRVLLLTDRNARVPVLIEGSGQKAVLSGTNGDKLVLKYIPEGAVLEKGSRVLTSGHGGMFPSGLPVGTVETLTGGEPEVALLTDLSRVTHVKVVDQESVVRRIE